MSCHWLASPCTQAIIATYEASQDLSDSTLGRPAVQDDETNDDDVDDGASSSLRPSPSPSCLVRGHHHRHRRRLHRPSNARQPYIRSDLCFLVSGAPSASPMRAGPRPGSRCTSPPPHIHARDTSSTTREREREKDFALAFVSPRVPPCQAAPLFRNRTMISEGLTATAVAAVAPAAAASSPLLMCRTLAPVHLPRRVRPCFFLLRFRDRRHGRSLL